MFRKLLFVFLLLLALSGAPSNAQKKEPSLSDKVGQMMKLASKRAVIRMNGDTFERLVMAPPRNYSVFVMFTALRQQGQCGICRVASAEFLLLATNWRYSSAFTNKAFFVTVDLDEASVVFFDKLKLDSVPSLLHFPSQGKPVPYDLERGHSAEHLARWVADQSDVHIQVTRPVDFTLPFLLGFLLAIAGGLAYANRHNLSFLLNRNVWAFSALCCVLLMISGQIWNHIRGPPFVYRNPGSKKQTFIHPSTQYQFGAETYVVGFFNAGATMAILLLCEAATSGLDIRMRKAMCLTGNIMVMLSFGCLLSVFRAKSEH